MSGTSQAVTWSDVDVNSAGADWSMALALEIRAKSTLLKPPNNLGLVGYWSFEDGSGTMATDHSGNGWTATTSAAGELPRG